MQLKIILLFFLFFLPIFTFGETYEYHSLAPIDNYVDKTEKIDETSFSNYLDNMFKLGIALCTGLAVLMIIIGGIQYVSSDAWSKKTEGRERIFAALFGLVIALGSYALLKTLDPRLLETRLELKRVDLSSIQTPQNNQNNSNPPTQQPPANTNTNPPSNNNASSTNNPPFSINVGGNEEFNQKILNVSRGLVESGITGIPFNVNSQGGYATAGGFVRPEDFGLMAQLGDANGLNVQYQLNSNSPLIQTLYDRGYSAHVHIIQEGENLAEGIYLYDKK